MKNPNRAAWLGALVGSTLGAPFRGAASTKRITFYEPVPARMAPSDALESWLVWAQHLESGGKPEGLARALFEGTRQAQAETGYARSGFRRGLESPLAGQWQNPLSSGSEAFGRAALWGLRFSGRPDEAMEWAWFDASIDHDSETAFLCSSMARILSLCEEQVPISELVRVLLSILPKGSRGHQAVHAAIQLLNQDLDLAAFKVGLAQAIGVTDGQHSAMSLGATTYALMKGRGEWDASISLAAGFGGAADSIGIVVGAILGRRLGEVPEDWTRPLGTDFVASMGLMLEDIPPTWEAWIERVAGPVIEIASNPVVDEVVVEPATAETAEPTEPQAPETEPAEISGVGEALQVAVAPIFVHPPIPAGLRELLQQTDYRSIYRVGDLRVVVEFPEGPVAQPKQGTGVVLRFVNLGADEAVVDPVWRANEGWEARHKLTSFRLRPGESNAFALVLKAPSQVAGPAGILEINSQSIPVTLHPLSTWYQVGPFPNAEGLGWDQSYRCENILNLKEVFNGRSNMAVRWAPAVFPDHFFDLEPAFSSGEGVVYLWNRLRFPDNPPASMICVASSGCQVWVNRQRVVRYYDVHQPVPRPILPYVAELGPEHEVEVMIKVMRAKQKLEPMVLTFFGADGQILIPESIGKLGG